MGVISTRLLADLEGSTLPVRPSSVLGIFPMSKSEFCSTLLTTSSRSYFAAFFFGNLVPYIGQMRHN